MGILVLGHAENLPKSKYVDSGQPAPSAQADLSRDFLQVHYLKEFGDDNLETTLFERVWRRQFGDNII